MYSQHTKGNPASLHIFHFKKNILIHYKVCPSGDDAYKWDLGHNNDFPFSNCSLTGYIID